MSIVIDYFIKTLLAGLGTLCFAVIFCVPRRHYLAALFTGAIGYFVYMLMIDMQLSVSIATLFATVVLTLFSRIFSIYQKAPITIFLFCGIFPLVPGAGIYYTALYFMQGDMSLFVEKGAETIKIALALAVGISFIIGIPFPKLNKKD